MVLKTSSSEKRKQPSRLRNSVWVERGAAWNGRPACAPGSLALRTGPGRSSQRQRCGPAGVHRKWRGSIPASSLISVDLPAPFMPTRAMPSLCSMTKFTFAKTL